MLDMGLLATTGVGNPNTGLIERTFGEKSPQDDGIILNKDVSR